MNPVARALTDVLALAASRMTAADVADVLLQPLVSRRFGLDGDGDAVHAWLREAGVCWGLDGEQKAAMGLPPDDSRCFFDGFYRLFLAYALPPDTVLPFGSRLPAGNPEGLGAAALGSLWHFVEQLRALRETLAAPRDANGWRDAVLAALDAFVCGETAELEDDLAVREAVARLFDCMGVDGGVMPVDAGVMRRALGAALDAPARGTMPSGAVTFAPMAGLRFLPFRFVCVIGLGDGAFPAEAKELEFDLMALSPRAGDVQRRDEDRNVFLDLLLAARERFYVSYTGKSVRDNAEKPPSVVVSELLDGIVRALASDRSRESLDAAKALVECRLVLRHPLQAFSRRYFDGSADSRMVSFHADFCRAQQERLARTAQGDAAAFSAAVWEDEDEAAFEPVLSMPFFAKALPFPEETWRDASLQELARFFLNPSRFLLQNRLGLSIPAFEDVLPSDEPLVASSLDPHRLASRVLPLLLAGEDMDRILEAAYAGLEFPSGALGTVLVEGMLDELTVFVSRFSGELSGPMMPPIAERLFFDVAGECWSLFGLLDAVREGGLLCYRFGRMESDGSVRFRMDAWVRHLFLNAVAPPGVLTRTVCWFSDGKVVFSPCPPETALALLADLIRLYREGLAEPLRFFPVSATAYVDGGDKMAAAFARWETGFGGRAGEGDDDFNRLATRGVAEPLDDAFVACAKRVLEPMREWMEKVDYDGGV